MTNASMKDKRNCRDVNSTGVYRLMDLRVYVTNKNIMWSRPPLSIRVPKVSAVPQTNFGGVGHLSVKQFLYSD